VDNLLSKGFLTLEVKRTGTGKDTRYLFAPVVPNTNSGPKSKVRANAVEEMILG
jgi:hypothetical protein